MRVSLADQVWGGDAPSLAIALGANLPSHAGGPIATLIAVRPRLEACVRQWSCEHAGGAALVRWSPLFETEPVGGPPGQPAYINAVMRVDRLAAGEALVDADGPGAADDPGAAAAELLLEQLQALEHQFGRERPVRWGPRSLDLDLLWWGTLTCHTPRLQLPHPLWRERDFVLAPLAALAGLAAMPQWTALPLAGRPGWPEQLPAEVLTRADALTRTVEPPGRPRAHPG